MIAHEKTDGQYIERQRAATTSDSESQRAVQQATTSATTRHNEREQSGTTRDNECQGIDERQRMTTSGHFGQSFFFSDKRGTYHHKP